MSFHFPFPHLTWVCASVDLLPAPPRGFLRVARSVVVYLLLLSWRGISTALGEALPILLVLLFLQVKVTVLADNDPSSQFHYLIQVSTGYRRKASTTAKVIEINVLHSLLCVFYYLRYTDLVICQCPIAFTRDQRMIFPSSRL